MVFTASCRYWFVPARALGGKVLMKSFIACAMIVKALVVSMTVSLREGYPTTATRQLCSDERFSSWSLCG